MEEANNLPDILKGVGAIITAVGGIVATIWVRRSQSKEDVTESPASKDSSTHEAWLNKLYERVESQDELLLSHQRELIAASTQVQELVATIDQLNTQLQELHNDYRSLQKDITEWLDQRGLLNEWHSRTTP